MIEGSTEQSIVADMIGRSDLKNYYNKHPHKIGSQIPAVCRCIDMKVHVIQEILRIRIHLFSVKPQTPVRFTSEIYQNRRGSVEGRKAVPGEKIPECLLHPEKR